MADLVSEIADLEAKFQRVADRDDWVCLAMPPWGKVGAPTIGELVTPTAAPPEPPSGIFDGSGRPLPASKPSLEERATYCKEVRRVRFFDEHGCEREGSIEEVANVLRMQEEMESWPGMLKHYGPPPWVMFPKDLRRGRVVEHVDALTWKAERLLVRVLDGPNQIPAEVHEQVQQQKRQCHVLGWVYWLRYAVSPSGPIWRIENYAQVAATGLMKLGDVVGAKREAGTPGAKTREKAPVLSELTTGQSADDGTGSKPAVKSANKGTQFGRVEDKIIGALNKWHKYADGSALNDTPIGNNELAKSADVSTGSASNFFKAQFGEKPRPKYEACCRDKNKLLAFLKNLNRDFTPNRLYGDKPFEKGGKGHKDDNSD